jgi:hypothetical protein
MSPFWVDIIGDIVNDVRNDTDKPASLDALEPYYDYGHGLDIVNKLSQKDRSTTEKFNKFPLIALIQPFTEPNGDDMTVRSSTNDMNIVIVQNTKPEIHPDERYDLNFRTILYPLYDLLMKHIVKSGYFKDVEEGLVVHDKVDRPYWGREGLYGGEANMLNDAVDAITIENLQLDLLILNQCKDKYYG